MAVFTFDPSDLIVTITGVPNDGRATPVNVSFTVTGFSETFLTISRPEPMWNTQVGAQGNVVRAKTNNTQADLTFSLQQNSPSHASLSELVDLATTTGNQDINYVFTIDITYRGHGAGVATFFNSPDAYIEKTPDATLGNTPQDWDWVIKCPTSTYNPANASILAVNSVP